MKLKRCEYPVLINTGQVRELTSVTWDETGVTFGAATTLSDIEMELQEAQSRHPGEGKGYAEGHSEICFSILIAPVAQTPVNEHVTLQHTL